MRYLVIKTDENLNRKIHIHDLASKLNRANSVLSKLKHFVSSEILRSVYFAMFRSHVNDVCLTWSLTKYPQDKIFILQKKAPRIINFPPSNFAHNTLFKNCRNLKL